MITKSDCQLGVKAIINNKVTKWNQELGTSYNGLVCHIFNKDGVKMGQEKELAPNTVIEILSGPKRFNSNGNQVKFKIEGSDVIMAAWWICFKHKVDKL
jgi:hypothetical protein